MSQALEYLNAIVSCFVYMNNRIKYVFIYLNLNSMLFSHKFFLQAEFGESKIMMHDGHYTTSVNCCRKYSATMTELLSVIWILTETRLLHISHYGDVIMGMIASQIISLTIVYSTVYSGADQRKHQSSASLAFAGEFTGDQWIPRTNGQ